MSPNFQAKLRKMIRVAIQEMQDGCCDCRKCKCLCREHLLVAMDMEDNPRKYFKSHLVNAHIPLSPERNGKA